jgi:hypothetical protein
MRDAVQGIIDGEKRTETDESEGRAMSDMKGKLKRRQQPSPEAISRMVAPAGLFFIGFGLWIGVSGELVGRGGGRIALGGVTRWVVGGIFMVLGGAICVAPLFYWLGRKLGGGSRGGVADSGGWAHVDAGEHVADEPSGKGIEPLAGWKRWAFFGCLAGMAALLVMIFGGIQAGNHRLAIGAVGGMMGVLAGLGLVKGDFRRISRSQQPVLFWILFGIYAFFAIFCLTFALAPQVIESLMVALAPVWAGRIARPAELQAGNETQPPHDPDEVCRLGRRERRGGAPSGCEIREIEYVQTMRWR